MKTKKPKNKLRLVLFLLGFAALTTSAITVSDLLGYSEIIIKKDVVKNTDSGSIDYNPPTEEQIQAGEEIKSQNQNLTTNDLGILISSKIQDGDTVKIRSIINGTVSNSGTCSISIRNNGSTYTATAPTSAMTSYSTCQGFNISKAELGSGDWIIDLPVTIDNNTSTVSDSFIVE